MPHSVTLLASLVRQTSAFNSSKRKKGNNNNNSNNRGSSRSSPSCCAERNLLNTWIARANRANVPRHQVVHWIRRKAGTEIVVWRHLADGTLGCSVPCVICKGVLQQFDLRVTCLVAPGQWYSGRLTDPDAPAAKPTSGQVRFVFKRT